MHKAIQSVVLAGNGLLRWPGREERVHYRVTVHLDSDVSGIRITPADLDILRRPSRHLGLYLHMPEGRRLALNVAATGHLSADGPMERSLDGQDWWVDTTPWLPFETPDRVTLSLRCGTEQVFESHATEEEAQAAFRRWSGVEAAEIRPPFGKPIRLETAVTKGASS